MKYTIIVDKRPSTNPTADKKIYTVDIEELRAKGDVYDSLIITKDEDYVMRRLSLSEYHVLSVLDNPVKEAIPGLNIELFEGDNYIYLADETGNKFYAEYLVKNEFNDIYVRVAEMNTAINQSSRQIELSVNQKLQSYSTTEEMNSIISAMADSINLKLDKKVDGETITGAYLILKINDDISEAKLAADKILLEGYITANGNFKIDTEGNMECKNAKILGDIQAGSKITGATIKGSTIQVGESNDFYVNSIGGVYCKNLSIIEEVESGYSTRFRVDNEIQDQRLYISAGHLKFGKYKTSTPQLELTNLNDSGHIWCNGTIEAKSFSNISCDKEKENIHKLGGYSKNKKITRKALDIIKNADVCEYNYKGTKNVTVGLVIGENYKTPDEVLNEAKNGIDLYSMCSFAWKGLQEAVQKIEKQNELIQNLQASIEKNKLEIEQIKERMNIYENNPKN